MRILIAHAEGEEDIADRIAEPLRACGYEVSHRGTVLVGDSVIQDASKVLEEGAIVVLCATVKAVGTGWAHLVLAAARRADARIYALHVEREAYLRLLTFDEVPALYWQDPERAIGQLITAIKRHCSPSGEPTRQAELAGAERRYRELALEACDIIDLANLPEIDRHVATRQFELRRLYVALRCNVAPLTDEQRPGKEALGASVRSRPDTAWRLTEPPFAGDPQPIGTRLAQARRLVVLGDPGAGKTTLLRWIATAYLLRLKDDPDFRQLPDVATLPDEDWLPVLVRCRELSAETLAGSFEEILLGTLLKAEMDRARAEVMRDVLVGKLAAGEALLLVDGLDEIADASARARFCRQLERFHVANPDAPVVVTSRIVGYREMNYKIKRGFEHVTVADLAHEDKDDFARRWCAVTEPRERQAAATADLIADIHSTDRVERLTGNPMLLTTMALVKRSIGKLPSRRAELYWNAVQVLLNWRGEVDAPLDRYEAIPQLEYIAYTMCSRGTQQLREDEILELLERMRCEYPQVHAVHQRSPHEFLRTLERRTGMLMESGYVIHRRRPVAVFEFRHLTFQEYLAGLALVDGVHPDRDRSLSLARRVAPLVTAPINRLAASRTPSRDSWNEAIRLCVASCNEDDVDDVLLAILRSPEEDSYANIERRSRLAAQCLADEPNAGMAVASEILEAVIGAAVAFDDEEERELRFSGLLGELLDSRWGQRLRGLLVQRYVESEESDRVAYGDLLADDDQIRALRTNTARNQWFSQRARELSVGDEQRKCEAALLLMGASYRCVELTHAELGIRANTLEAIVARLVAMLDETSATAHAASWALMWLARTGASADHLVGERASHGRVAKGTWSLGEDAIAAIAAFMRRGVAGEPVARFLLDTLGHAGAVGAEDVIAAYARHPDEATVQAAIEALGHIQSPSARRHLYEIVEHSKDWEVTTVLDAIQIVGALRGARAKRAIMASCRASNAMVRRAGIMGAGLDRGEMVLLSRDLNGVQPFVDPRRAVTLSRVRKAAGRMDVTEDEVKALYEKLAAKLGMKLAWPVAPVANHRP
jgi:NACHT domain/HEAT repeats